MHTPTLLPEEANAEAPPQVIELRQRFRDFPINAKPDPKLERNLEPGFLLPYLLDLDAMTYGRWDYWMEAMLSGCLPDHPIPPIDWQTPYPRTRKMLETTLNLIPRHGSWQTMGGWDYFRYLLQWMLWGFGHPGYGEPSEPGGCEGASLRVYQCLNIGALMLWPSDYFGDLLAENSYGKKQGFFPTPMPICSLMTEMLMGNTEEDLRTKTVCDPAVGTGRFLLTASNHSLRLYGVDIDPTLCVATLVNGYLFAPWMAKPFPFLEGEGETAEQFPQSAADTTIVRVSESIQPETAEKSEEAFRFEAVTGRREGEQEARQGVLF